MRASQIIWVGPKSNDKCPHKRPTERDALREEEEAT